MGKLKYAILSILLSSIYILSGQNYPVQSTVLLNPPYTLSLPLYSTNPDQIQVQLLNKDFATPLVEVFLQLRIEGPGITLETKAEYRPAVPITLTAGIPVILNGVEIKDLFNPVNLNVQGLDQHQFLSGGSYLPEGQYKFSIWARTYHQNLQVSNIGNAFAGIYKHLPPIINLPQDKSFIALQAPQFLQIQFTPRHTISSELMSRIRYRIKLVEVLPSGRNPNEAMQSSSLPFFETLTDQTNFIYGAGEPQMVEGRTYALQVQAIDADGKDFFDNNGYSEVVSFVYGGQCPVPQQLKVVRQDGNSAEFTWNENNRYRSYVIYHRTKGQNFFKSELAFSNAFTLTSLQPETAYEVKVSGVCSENESDATPVLTFKTGNTTGDYQQLAKNCGKALPSVDLSNKTPLAILQSGDIIKAADFDIRITASTGGNGLFSGAGLVTLPFTGKVSIPCSFEKIHINTDKRLMDGKISLLQQPFEISNLTLKNTGVKWRNMFGKNWNHYSDKQYVGSIKNIWLDPDGFIRIDGNAGEQKITKGSNIKITDSNGKSWYISAGGKISEAEGPLGEPIVKNTETGEGTPTELPPGIAKVFFYSDAGKAIDAFEISQLTAGKTYDQMECTDTAYFPAWKLALAGEKFEINAILHQSRQLPCPLDSIRFVRSDGTILPFTRKGNAFTISATGRMHLYADAIWATATYSLSDKTAPKRWILGKINLINVDMKQQPVVLVPVNKTGIQTDVKVLQGKLDEVYYKYAVQLNVFKDYSLQINNYNAETDVTDADKTSINAGYSSNLTAIIEAYKTGKTHLKPNAGNDTVYIFMLNKSTDQTAGFMIAGERFGFVFLNGENTANAHTLAHEVGHGAFSLEHVFGDDAAKTGKSQNLMDYAPPFTLLNYDQWMQIIDPAARINLFQSEDKGKFVSVHNVSQFKELANSDGSYTFISPGGTYITLPEQCEGLVFSTLNRGYFALENGLRKPSHLLFPLGSLTGFKTGNTIYHYMDGVGYVDENEDIYKSSRASSEFRDGIVVYTTFSKYNSNIIAGRFNSALKQASDSKSGAGKMLKSFAVVDFSEGELKEDFRKVMAAKRQGSKFIEHVKGQFGILGNDEIRFTFNDTSYNASEFLIKILTENSTVSDYIYYFQLANLKQNDYYSFVDCLKDKINSRSIVIERSLIAARATRKDEIPMLAKHVNDNSEALFNELNQLQMDDLTHYVQNGAVLAKFMHKAKVDQWTASQIFGHFKEHDYPSCHFSAPAIEDRLYVIQTLIVDEDRWVCNGKNLIHALIRSTPAYDIETLLKKGFIQNKFQWLSQLWTHRNEMETEPVFETINNWLYEYYDRLDIKPSEGSVDFTEFSASPLKYKKNENEFLAGIKENSSDLEIIPQKFSIHCKGGYFIGSMYLPAVPSEITINKDGYITFRQTYRVNQLSSQLFDPKHPPQLQSIVDYEETFNPFEIISITIGGNYFSKGLQAGQTLEMPAFMAMQLQDQLERQVLDEQTKKLVNTAIIGITLISVVNSGGASLNLSSALLMATLSADNAMTNYKNSLKTQAEWEANKEFFGEWDAFHTAAEYAFALEGVYDVGKMVIPKIGSRINFVKQWNRLKQFCKGKILKKEVTAIIENISAVKLQTEFKVGDKINGITIERIRPGTNGKTAFIGRGMGGDGSFKGIKDIYKFMKEQGYSNIEIFDEISLTNKWRDEFIEAVNEFNDLTNNGTKFLDNETILLSLMYKLDEKWVDMVLKEGYTIIDFGDLYLKSNIIKGESPFYNMETFKVFYK